MSVINNVLKDLETRESRFTPIEITSVEAPAAARRDLKPMAIRLLLLLLLAAAGWIYLQQQTAPVVAAPVTLTSVDTPPATVAATDSSQPLEPTSMEDPAEVANVADGVVTDQMIGNQIIGLQIRESEQEMRMEFVLRDRMVAYLKERGENSFVYHLRKIESQIVAPILKDNPWIRTLAITPADQGVDIEFVTAPEILVETRQSLVDGEPVWAINLRKAVPQPVTSTASARAVTNSAPAATTAEPTSEQILSVAPRALPETQVPASDAEPEAPAAESAASIVKLEINSTNPNAKSTSQLEYALELINSRRLTDAENLLLKLLGGVEDYKARQHLLVLYQGRQHANRFARLVRDSVARYPDDALFRTEYARSLFHKTAYREVIELLSGTSALDTDQQALVAASYQRLDEHADAIRYYRQALQQDASNAKNWIGLGISQEHSSELAAALDSYQRAGRLGTLNRRLQAFVDKRSDTLRRVLN